MEKRYIVNAEIKVLVLDDNGCVTETRQILKHKQIANKVEDIISFNEVIRRVKNEPANV